ncbi:hypothetical protein NPIL_397551 [Nephila pilipes]|uniref:Uncharacterized protein n=1 Tax=Nephila pilipes TaxID=299642 RepID=A0A8X6TTF6_NEPPI|nr:hypothetical protein NPIL_397551 [Nephila pilipes]
MHEVQTMSSFLDLMILDSFCPWASCEHWAPVITGAYDVTNTRRIAARNNNDHIRVWKVVRYRKFADRMKNSLETR